MHDRLTTAAATVVILGFVAFFGWLIWFSVSQSVGNEQTQVCTVEEKDRTTLPKGGSDMRIYTEECGVLRVGDLLLQGQFDSANLYSDIDPGNVYEFTTVGVRVPFLSEFPTIIKVEEVA